MSQNLASFSGFDQAILVIYSNSLDYGVYYLTYSARIIYSNDMGVTTLFLQDTTQTFIDIVPSGVNVFAFENGISQRTYGTSQRIVIDPGSFSIDMDKLVNPSTLNYTFYCQQMGIGQTTSSFFSTGTIRRLGSLPNMFQVYNSTIGSNCFTCKTIIYYLTKT